MSFLIALFFTLLTAQTKLIGQPRQSSPAGKIFPSQEDVQFAGAPLVQNFTKTVYQAGNQNWSVSCGSNGTMYFANSDGLLAFDGQHWRLSTMPRKVIVRGIAVGKEGEIYSGGFGQFGIWNK